MNVKNAKDHPGVPVNVAMVWAGERNFISTASDISFLLFLKKKKKMRKN
jgi:hypothetical protein